MGWEKPRLRWTSKTPPMDNILTWNVRALNWPNKQEDIKCFLQLNKVGLVGLQETNVKRGNNVSVANRLFQGWQWRNNSELNPKGRIWIAWKPQVYNVWCVLGDFNTILIAEDRMGDIEINDNEIRDFANCLEVWDLQEMRSVGPYHSWTNKIVWTKIDRVIINPLWYDVFDFASLWYDVLSDHTRIIVEFLHYPGMTPEFSYCDMWCMGPNFSDIIETHYRSRPIGNKLYQLKHLLGSLKKDLMKLNKNKYSDFMHSMLRQEMISLIFNSSC
ncbi:hypothetical protein Cgig2_001054 [Carnegiea gigantea]|uniref:Reverse transcriptase n=1 Tax=Carnegiea gigantea TaxID=171969 RepID=A0A9Q1GHN2_9CARY|nr:hypothetical protein Cgig2_001054 [Carnegiea gigantea]